MAAVETASVSRIMIIAASCANPFAMSFIVSFPSKTMRCPVPASVLCNDYASYRTEPSLKIRVERMMNLWNDLEAAERRA